MAHTQQIPTQHPPRTLRKSSFSVEMMPHCRRHAAWSIATFTDAALTSFIVPIGPLLLLLSHLHSTRKDVMGSEVGEHWAVVARLWSQAFAGFLAGRTAGRVIGPAAASRLGLTVVVTVGVVGSAATQAWLGLAGLTEGRFFWARTMGGLFVGALCSGVLSLSAPCPRGSSCKRCSTLPGSKYFSEIPSAGRGGFDCSSSTAVAASLRRADTRWHLGLVLGLLIGGLCYDLGGSDAKLGTGPSSWLKDRPAFVACAAACSIVLVVSAVTWRRTGNNAREGANGSEPVAACGGIGIWGVFSRRRQAGQDLGGSRGRKGAWTADSGSGLEWGQEDEKDGSEGTRLFGDVSVHDPGLSASEQDGNGDVEAGGGEGRAPDAPVPSRYLVACKGDAAAAKKMWDATAKWRVETGAGRSLSTPQPTLQIIKECYPYFLHGRSKKAEVVVYEQTGKMQFGRLADAGVTPFDMQMHYAFFNDFVFTKLISADDDDAQLMTVLDVGELRLASLKNNTIVTKYLAATAEVMQKHYPERQSRILVVNAPWWFAGIWKGVSGVLSSGTQAKLQIRGTNFLPTLLEYVDASQIPPEYGGDSPQALGQSAEEVALREMASSLGPTSLPKQGGAARSRSGPGPGGSSGDGSGVGGAADGDSSGGDGILKLDSGGGGASGVMEEGGTLGDFVGGGSGGGGSHHPTGSNESSITHPSPRPRERSAVSASAGAREDAVDGGENASRSAGGLGATQRFASALRRMRGSATRAYLGVENKFRYDTARRVWVMEGEERGRARGGRRSRRNGGGGSDDGESSRTERGAKQDESATQNDGEKEASEKNLIRAIQAAQQARGGAKSVFSSQSNGAAGNGGDIARTWRMDGPPPGSGGGGESTAAAVLALHLVWLALEAAFEALLPLWMLSPEGPGGLGCSAAEISVVLAIAVAALAFPRYCSPDALLRMTTRSPVRTLRAATIAQVVTATFLSGLATPGWTWTPRFSREATFAGVTLAVATSRAASAALARPALGNLLSVALGHIGGGGSAGGGSSGGVNDRYHRRRSADSTLLAVFVGVAQSIGVLAMGVVFSRSVRAHAGAGVVCFRLVGAAFVGVYLATLFVHASDGTAGVAGGRGRWRGSSGPWLVLCDCVEQATASATVSSPPMSSYTLGGAWGGDQAGGGWSTGGSDLAKES